MSKFIRKLVTFTFFLVNSNKLKGLGAVSFWCVMNAQAGSKVSPVTPPHCNRGLEIKGPTLTPPTSQYIELLCRCKYPYSRRGGWVNREERGKEKPGRSGWKIKETWVILARTYTGHSVRTQPAFFSFVFLVKLRLLIRCRWHRVSPFDCWVGGFFFFFNGKETFYTEPSSQLKTNKGTQKGECIYL